MATQPDYLDLIGGVPRLALYYSEHPEEYGHLIEQMVSERLFTLNDWHEFVLCLTPEQQNQLIATAMKMGLATERRLPNGSYVYTLRFPIAKQKAVRKPKPTDAQVCYEMDMDAWQARWNGYVLMYGDPALIPPTLAVNLLKNKPKPPRIRVKQYGNVRHLVVQPKKEKPE